MNDEMFNRRPLASRQKLIFHRLAETLVKAGLTPNDVSILSAVFSAISGFIFFSSGYEGSSPWITLPAVIFVQLRLLCNLLDGLMAIEGGLKTETGELFNDIPDRISDVFVLVGVGYACRTMGPYGVILGWSAAIAAVLTAYVRVLGASLGTGHFFLGPMAKQHRMFVVTVAGIGAIFEKFRHASCYVLLVALVLILLGSLATCWRRLRVISDELNGN